MKSVWWYRGLAVSGAALILAGCAVRKSVPIEQALAEPAGMVAVKCQPAEAGSKLIGTWQSNTRPRGVAGDFRALIVLAADGSMAYDSQVKVGKRIRPGLREAGCWQMADGVLTLQTTKSYGEPVDTEDPIYQNRYRLEKAEPARLTLRELRSGGQVITARRMQPGYRLPD
ncbi:hypothetical protein [Bordetella tumulicola]|uniref:hypothetical protein n=1 Tax=Bordetella tumulicola TaxID=1649133 RepID=UPI0039EFFC5B